ncbi:NHL repeat-containing protein [Mycobacterium sp. 360MFTsu5.1]|uniref:NHL repeat-containing protein n=1 Tax=Mycobacterium sp. 360MFTsu5.1 TaxID=1172186 RepID=UPI00036E050D|nr:NHL repeat-containing protein [Mycobacterium sp. 360MFTsu5.1]
MKRLISALLVIVAGVTGCSHASAPVPEPSPPAAPTQSVLPFTGLNGPYDVAVDAADNVFVSDVPAGRNGVNRVIELPAGSNAQKVLPFARATVMTNPAGEVWVIDGGHSPSHLVKLAHDGEQQTVLPMPDLGREYRGVIQAVDAVGGFYGMVGGGEDSGRRCCLPVQVAKQAPGSNAPAALPFQHMSVAAGMTVDAAGNLYVGDPVGKRVLKLAPGASSPSELPFHALRSVIDIAVDAKSAVYVVDGQQNRVLKLDPGASAPTVLPFTGLKGPVSIAVGTTGAVYVVDDGNRRIVKLEGAR